MDEEVVEHSQTDVLGCIIDYEVASELARFYDRLLEPEADDDFYLTEEKPLAAAATA